MILRAQFHVKTKQIWEPSAIEKSGSSLSSSLHVPATLSL